MQGASVRYGSPPPTCLIPTCASGCAQRLERHAAAKPRVEGWLACSISMSGAITCSSTISRAQLSSSLSANPHSAHAAYLWGEKGEGARGEHLHATPHRAHAAYCWDWRRSSVRSLMRGGNQRQSGRQSRTAGTGGDRR